MSSQAEISSVTPLSTLNAVVLDTETTGLNVEKARIIQVGCVRVSRGQILAEDTFEMLVNPGEPIPPESTEIHGITDSDVANASPFASANEAMNSWAGNAITIGYSIGYDLAIMKRESRLAGISWHAPRSLDVRHMVHVLSPQLPDYSLEMVASWLGVPSENRHQALADALITANVFQQLVPKLGDMGIRTLAELELACRRVSRDRMIEAEAGWYDFLHEDRSERTLAHTLARIDSYPYRHRVRDVMSAPVKTVSCDLSVKQALSIVINKNLSSVLVRYPGSPPDYGIVTERDLLRVFDRDGGQALEIPVGDLASRNLVTIGQDAFLYRAMGLMARHGLRHLVAKSPQGELAGILTSGDLLKQRSDDALNLGDAINQANSQHELDLVWANLALVATALDREDVDARDIAAVISRELRALTRRCCEIAESEMDASGLGDPPVPYAMMVLGSGGRGESLLAMDQDNAIVYSDEVPMGISKKDVDQWFAELGSRVSKLLDGCGVPFCKGGIMGMNPDWRMSVSQWKAKIDTWITRTSPKDILNTDIFFDAVSVHGDHGLMEEIRVHAMNRGSRSREFLHLLTTNASDINVPLGAFGRFKLKDGRMDVKMGGILPIFSAARVEAIRNSIMENSTPARLAGLKAIGSYSSQVIDNLDEAHQILLTRILKQQLYDLDNGIPLSNRIEPDKMNSAARNNIKWALEQVPSVTDLLGVPA